MIGQTISHYKIIEKLGEGGMGVVQRLNYLECPKHTARSIDHKDGILCMKTSIDPAGRMVIPKQIREAAGLRPGELLEVTYRDGRIEIEPAAVEVKLIWKGRLLVARLPGVRPLRHEQVNDALHGLRQRVS